MQRHIDGLITTALELGAVVTDLQSGVSRFDELFGTLRGDQHDQAAALEQLEREAEEVIRQIETAAGEGDEVIRMLGGASLSKLVAIASDRRASLVKWIGIAR